MGNHAGHLFKQHFTNKSTKPQTPRNTVTNGLAVGRPEKANHSRLFDLPLEIRLMIYPLCAEKPTRCNWVYDLNAFQRAHDRSRKKRRLGVCSSLLAMGSGKIAKNLLLTCKQVYAEAVENMYKEIKMIITILSSRDSRMDHWFLCHPFRHTKNVVMTIDLNAETLFGHRRLEEQRGPEDLANALNQMPNLVKYDIFQHKYGFVLEYLRDQNLQVRPHSKLHQVFILKEFLRLGITFRFIFGFWELLNKNQPSQYEIKLQDDLIRLFERRAWELESHDRKKGLEFVLRRPNPDPGKAGQLKDGFIANLYTDPYPKSDETQLQRSGRGVWRSAICCWGGSQGI